MKKVTNTGISPHVPVLSAAELSVGYPSKNGAVVVQNDVRLKLFSGELVCLIGPNGAGKSTLLRTLCGLQEALSGKIFLSGKPLQAYTRHQLSTMVSVVLTDRVVVDHMKVYDLVSMGRYPYTGYFGRCSVLDQEVIMEAMELTGIGALSHRYLGELSDGERQKVMISRALAQETPIIVLDEPMAFLDFPSKLELMQIIKKLVRVHGKSILLTTHDLSLSIKSADWIWMIATGKRMQRGVPEDLVLKGAFADYFNKETIHFDANTGDFKINFKTGKNICVWGNGLTAQWIRKALIRKGYNVVDQPKGKADIVVDDGPPPEIKVNSGTAPFTVNSVRELLLKL